MVGDTPPSQDDTHTPYLVILADLV